MIHQIISVVDSEETLVGVFETPRTDLDNVRKIIEKLCEDWVAGFGENEFVPLCKYLADHLFDEEVFLVDNIITIKTTI